MKMIIIISILIIITIMIDLTLINKAKNEVPLIDMSATPDCRAEEKEKENKNIPIPPE